MGVIFLITWQNVRMSKDKQSILSELHNPCHESFRTKDYWEMIQSVIDVSCKEESITSYNHYHYRNNIHSDKMSIVFWSLIEFYNYCFDPQLKANYCQPYFVQGRQLAKQTINGQLPSIIACFFPTALLVFWAK